MEAVFYNEQTYTGECTAALDLYVCLHLDRLKKLVGSNLSVPVILMVRTQVFLLIIDDYKMSEMFSLRGILSNSREGEELIIVCIIPWKTAIFDTRSLRLTERDRKNQWLEREAAHLQSRNQMHIL